MKVVFVVGDLPHGSIENLPFNVCLELKKRKIEFRVLNLSGTGKKLHEFTKKGIQVVSLTKGFLFENTNEGETL